MTTERQSTGAISRADASLRPRLRTLDGARGLALVLMMVSHSLMLFPGEGLARWEYAATNALLVLTKVATPLFVWVFGMTMAYVYFPRLEDPGTASLLRKRLWKRAALVFASHEFLVLVVDSAQKAPPEFIVNRLLYLQMGYWVEVLNFYLVVLLLSPWTLAWWKSAGKGLRLLLIPLLYATGYALAEVRVPPSILAIQNVIAGYSQSEFSAYPPDTFPVLQLSSFYLVGLWFGEHMTAKLREGGVRTLVTKGAFLAAACLLASFLVSSDAPAEYLRALARDHYKFPPLPAYVLFGLSGVLAFTLACLWALEVKGIDNRLTRIVGVLGRNSLFTFNAQYVVLFLLFGLVLDLLHRQHLPGILALIAVLVAVTAAAAFFWERVKQRWKKRNSLRKANLDKPG